jgi:hypothetical protein
MTIHNVVVSLCHALTAFAAAFAMVKEQSSCVGYREFRGIAPKGPGAHLALGRDPESVRFLAAIKLPPLAMAVRVHDVDDPARRLAAIGVFPCALANRHASSPRRTLTFDSGAANRKRS